VVVHTFVESARTRGKPFGRQLPGRQFGGRLMGTNQDARSAGAANVFRNLVTDFTTLLVTINPISVVPVFLGLTGGKSRAERRRTALRACLVATAILLFFLIVGQLLMEAIGISLPAFRLAGGLVLLTLGLRMIYGDVASGPGSGEISGDITVFPLATPMLAGGGAITAIVILTDNYTFSILEQASTAIIMMVVMAVSYLVLVSAEPIQRWIGETGTNVIGRIMGLILAALAMQTLVTAVKSILPPGMIL
jgi:multiple antibiotic resistance protein